MIERREIPHLRWTSPPVVLAIVIIVGFFATLAAMMFMKQSTDMMVGALIAAFTGVIGYFYGSSSQSAGKDVAIAELTKTAATVANTAQATQASTTAAAGLGGPMQAGDVAIQADTVTVKGNP